MLDPSISSPAGRPVIFGEVLFDCFPDGGVVLGGAPFNVAWHLRGFGLDPLFISRVGNDVLGDKVRKAMARWGLDQSGLQGDGDHATGQVKITLHNNQPAFEITPDQAYDFIDVDAALTAVGEKAVSLLYHGSLAARSATSAAALAGLQARIGRRFVDINLRAPWWNNEAVIDMARASHWLKLNDEELFELSGVAPTDADIKQLAQQFAERYQVPVLIVTMGADGAFICAEGELIERPPVPVVQLVDTVGAGDAFASVILLAAVKGWSPEQAVARALTFASTICGQQGATNAEPEFYQRFLHAWEENLVK